MSRSAYGALVSAEVNRRKFYPAGAEFLTASIIWLSRRLNIFV
jgi:hypothetical protein